MKQVLVFVFATLLAASAQASPRQKKVMVLQFPPVQGVSATALKTLDQYLAGKVRNQGFSVVTPAQIGAVLGLDRQKQLLGCSENSCLAEIGGALGVDYSVIPSAAVFGSKMAITLTAIDDKGVTIGSEDDVVSSKDTEQLLSAIDELVPKLMDEVNGGSPRVNLAPSNAESAAGGLTSSANVGFTRPKGSYVVMGIGVAAIVASVVMGIVAENAKTNYDKARKDAWISTGLTVVGVGMAIGGGIWWIEGRKAEGSR